MGERYSLFVAYDGPAVRDGSMDINELAPAMVALGQLFQLAHQQANGGQTRLIVEVKAFEPGSVGIDLLLDVNLGDQVRQLFGVADLLDAKDIATILFGSKGVAGAAIGIAGAGISGLFALLKWLKDGKPKKAEPTANGNIQVTIGDGDNNTVLIVTPQALELASNDQARIAAAKVVRPLSAEGIDELYAKERRTDVQVLERITRAEAKAIGTPPPKGVDPADVVLDSTHEGVFLVRTPDLVKPNSKWRLCRDAKDPGIYATIEDQKFLSEVANHSVRFGAGDAMRARLRTVQTIRDGKLESHHVVVEVVKFIELRTPVQLALPPPDPKKLPPGKPPGKD